MDNEKTISAEELAAEQAAVQVPKEEDVRNEIITEFGFDETVDGEKIDKLVAKQMESKKMLSKTIAQKIKHRTEAEELRKKSASVTTDDSKKNDTGLSIKDWKALQDVHDDDVEEIVEYAKFKKISVADAKKSGVIQTLLKDKEEQRKVASASNTGTARRSSVKISDEEIVNQMEKGQVPEDPEALARARWALKKKK